MGRGVDGVTGKLTELDNAESFSKAIVDLMADPVKLSKMGKQARHTVEREHSIKEASQQINTALMRLVDG